MADWYVSQTIWAALPQWQANNAYTVGQIIRPLTAGGTFNECAYQCTAASGNSGGSEPSFNLNNSGTTTDGGVTWTNLTGQSATAWATPAGSVATLSSGDTVPNRLGTGDSIFIDSTHAETGANGDMFNDLNRNITMYSVNAGGSVPPVAADYTPGATITFASGQRLFIYGKFVSYGINYALISAPSSAINLQDSTTIKFRDAVISNTGNVYLFLWNSSNSLILENVTLNVAAGTIAYFYVTGGGSLTWVNTTNACFAGGNYATYLVFSGNSTCTPTLFEALDLSSFGGSIVFHSADTPFWPIHLNGIVLPASVPLIDFGGTNVNAQLDAYDCAISNNNYGHFFISSLGTILTDESVYLSGGANDGVNPFSHKIIASASLGPNDSVDVLDSFDIVSQCSNPGTALTATVNLVSASVSLTEGDIFLDLFYPGSNSSCKTSKISTGKPLSITTLSAGSTNWFNTPLSPSYYSLSLTFTPQARGLVRARIRVQKPSLNIWYDPVLNGVS